MRPASPRPPPPTPILRRMRRCGWRRTYHTDSTRNSQGITRREHLCALTFETPVFGCFVWFITFFTAFLFLRKWERCKRRVAVSSSRVSHRGRVPVGVHRAQSYGFTVYRRGVARVGWSDGSLASLSFRLSVLLYRGPRVLAFAHSPGPLASCAIGLKLLQVGDRCLQGVEAANEGEPQVAATEARIHLRRVAKIEIIALANRILGGGRAKA
jgi:hypothetical protein